METTIIFSGVVLLLFAALIFIARKPSSTSHYHGTVNQFYFGKEEEKTSSALDIIGDERFTNGLQKAAEAWKTAQTKTVEIKTAEKVKQLED